jgi:hypothetical protein
MTPAEYMDSDYAENYDPGQKFMYISVNEDKDIFLILYNPITYKYDLFPVLLSFQSKIIRITHR